MGDLSQLPVPLGVQALLLSDPAGAPTRRVRRTRPPDPGSVYFARRVPPVMVNVPAAAAAGVVVLLFGAALVSMANGNLMLAGLSFLGASVLIYLRETRLLAD